MDDFSKKLWVYFISNKNQVLEKFQQFVHTIENSTGRTIQSFRSNNGGKYTSQAFCNLKGINREFTPPHTPQQNGVAERCNHSLLDITECHLLDRALPGHLWGEAVKAVSIILNLRFQPREILTKPLTNSSQVLNPLSHTYEYLFYQSLFMFLKHLKLNSSRVP